MKHSGCEETPNHLCNCTNKGSITLNNPLRYLFLARLCEVFSEERRRHHLLRALTPNCYYQIKSRSRFEKNAKKEHFAYSTERGTVHGTTNREQWQHLKHYVTDALTRK